MTTEQEYLVFYPREESRENTRLRRMIDKTIIKHGGSIPFLKLLEELRKEGFTFVGRAGYTRGEIEVLGIPFCHTYRRVVTDTSPPTGMVSFHF